MGNYWKMRTFPVRIVRTGKDVEIKGEENPDLYQNSGSGVVVHHSCDEAVKAQPYESP